MISSDILNIKLQLAQIDLQNLQQLLKIGETVGVKVIDINDNFVTINLKNYTLKAFSNINFQKGDIVKVSVASVAPQIELKLIQEPLNSKQILLKNILDNLTQNLLQNTKDSTLENLPEKQLAEYIHSNISTITNFLSNNNINLNENVFIVIPFYANNTQYELYVKQKSKKLKSNKIRQQLTIYSQTPFGLLRINLLKIDFLFCNLWTYDNDFFELLSVNKKELEQLINASVRVLLKTQKPKIEYVKLIRYLDTKA